MDIVSSSCKPRIVCRWPFAVANVEASASADEVTANVNLIVYVCTSVLLNTRRGGGNPMMIMIVMER